MTSEDLRALILSNPDAKALAIDGQDEACAALIRPLMPWEPVAESRLGELGILALFPNPYDADTLLTKLETIAQSDGVVRRALKHIQPEAVQKLDMGMPSTRAMLDALLAGSLITDVEHATLKRSGERQVAVTTDEVSAALLPLRKEGKAKQANWLGD